MTTTIKLAILALVAAAGTALAGPSVSVSYYGSNYRVGVTHHKAHSYRGHHQVQRSHYSHRPQRKHYVQPQRYRTSYRAPQRYHAPKRYVSVKRHYVGCRR